jgi:hypothetical protein
MGSWDYHTIGSDLNVANLSDLVTGSYRSPDAALELLYNEIKTRDWRFMIVQDIYWRPGDLPEDFDVGIVRYTRTGRYRFMAKRDLVSTEELRPITGGNLSDQLWMMLTRAEFDPVVFDDDLFPAILASADCVAVTAFDDEGFVLACRPAELAPI